MWPTMPTRPRPSSPPPSLSPPSPPPKRCDLARQDKGALVALALVALARAVAGGCGGGAAAAGPGDGASADGLSGGPGETTLCSETLFGQPGVHTGLSASQCAPRCGCGGAAWTPRAWSADDLTSLRAYELLDPPSALAVDPYSDAALDVAPPPAALACAVRLVDTPKRHYRLRTQPSAAAAMAVGDIVTHAGRCGQCSSLQDLAVYAGTSDLTTPVRQCGLSGAAGGHAAGVKCLLELGFSEACVDIWAWNVENTRKACLDVCLSLIKAPSHLPDGALNACIACDEAHSGPVFKAVAGRTRRNSGLPSALCRPCASVARVEHLYP